MSSELPGDVQGGAAQRSELEFLRARVVELEAQVAGAPAPGSPRRRSRWRAVTATVLITLGCLLAPLSIVTVYASDQLSDTDRYVQTVSPLAEDPAVQRAITNEVTQLIFTYVDVDALVHQAVDELSARGLSPQVAAPLQGMAGPITNGVENFTHSQVAKAVHSPRFAQAWDQVNRVAHEQVVNVLSGSQQGAVTGQNGAITVNLAPVVAQVKQRLVAQGFNLANRIPAVDAKVTVLQSDQLTRAQSLYRVLTRLGAWLPVISLVLIGCGIYVATGHRRALVGAGLGVAGAMLLLGVGLAVVRVMYMNEVPSAVLPTDAASAVFDTLVWPLRQALRATFVAALVIAVAAFLTGGSVTAVRTRAALAAGVGRTADAAQSAGLRTGPVGPWVLTHRRWLRLAVVAAGAAVLTFWSHPTVAVVLGITAIVLVVLVLVELLARTAVQGRTLPTAPTGGAAVGSGQP